MAWRWTKEENNEYAILVDGFDKGVGVSPHKGIANMQNVNISTESGEVTVSYSRTQQSQPGATATTFSVSVLDSSHLSTSASIINGSWITVDGGITGLSAGNYYVQNSNGTPTGAASTFQLSSTYNGTIVTGMSGGPATGNLLRAMGQPVGYATETYNNSGSLAYRYFVLDAQGLVWVYDSAQVNSPVTGTLNWFLPDSSITYYTGGVNAGSTPTGIAVLNGWIHVFAGSTIWCKPTVLLGVTFASFASGSMVSPPTSPSPHFSYVGHQGKLYYTDGNFLGSIFPNTSLVSGVTNIQSYASYTASTTTGTVGTLFGGSLPTTSTGTTRIPATFFTSGSLPTAINGSSTSAGGFTQSIIFYILYSTSGNTFQVFAAASGGAALDIATGSSGTQYFTTYCPVTSAGEATITFTPERLNLPFFETATAITEIGNTVIIGTKLNVLYPWNQVDVLPGDLIPLPENNTTFLLTVNNMAYVFAGNKGNIYITNGSTASFALTIPDYCAGIAGSKNTYIEPYFVWGGAAYIRGRVYFSILDQTSSKAGNCGGIWSFVPTQNFFIGQDFGLALRLENQNSYNTYNGVATVIIPSQTQNANSPQYWAAWYSSISSPTYGIDFTNESSVTQTATIETDLIPTGTLLNKDTFKQVEYKLSSPMATSESVAISARQDSTSSYVSMGTVVQESTTALSGYFPVNFEKGQWLQLKITLTPSSGTPANSSFVRLKEIRIR